MQITLVYNYSIKMQYSKTKPNRKLLPNKQLNIKAKNENESNAVSQTVLQKAALLSETLY